MNPYRATYPRDEATTTVGDAGLLGVDMLRDPGVLPPGLVSEARNYRFAERVAVPRGGIVKLPTRIGTWFPSGYPVDLTQRVAFDSMHGAGVFGDTRDLQWVVIAANDRFYGRGPNGTFRPLLYNGALQTLDLPDSVVFVQASGRLVALRGDTLAVLVLDQLGTGFNSVTQVNSEAGQGTGTAPVPPSRWGIYFQGRLVLISGDLIYASDVGNITRYALPAVWQLSKGSADFMTGVYQFNDITLVVSRERSLYALTNLIPDAQGDYTDAQFSVISNNLGIVSPQTVVQIGNRLLGLSQRGVVAIVQTQLNKLQVATDDEGNELLLSNPIRPLIERIHARHRSQARGIYYRGRYYLAVPLDAGEVVMPDLLANTGATYAIDPDNDPVWNDGDAPAWAGAPCAGPRSEFQSNYYWGLALGQDPNGQLSAAQVAWHKAMFAVEWAAYAALNPGANHGPLYWAYQSGLAGGAYGAVQKMPNLDPNDAGTNVNVLFAVGATIRAERCPAVGDGTWTTRQLLLGRRYRLTFGANETGAVVGDQTFDPADSLVVDFEATSETLTLTGENEESVTATLQPLFSGVNNAVLVYNEFDGVWEGYDTSRALTVRDWYIARYNGEDRLHFVSADGFENLYEEGTEDDVCYESLRPVLEVRVSNSPREGDTLRVAGGTIITARERSVNAATTWSAPDLAGAIAALQSGYTTALWTAAGVTAEAIPGGVRFTSASATAPAVVITGNWAATRITWEFATGRDIWREPVTCLLRTRGYSAGELGRQVNAELFLATSDPAYSITVVNEGASARSTVVTDERADRRRYSTTRAPYTLTNADDDFADAKRQDYSVNLNAATAIAIGTGLLPDLAQEFTRRVQFVRTGRYAQIELEGSQGRVSVRGVSIGVRAGVRKSGKIV